MSNNPPGDLDARQAKFKEASDFAVSMLAQFQPREQVLDELVERFGIDYPEAESLLKHVESQDQSQIQARQFPIILILGIGTVILGVGVLVIYMNAILNWGLLVTGVGLIMGGAVGVLEALSGVVSSLFRRN